MRNVAIKVISKVIFFNNGVVSAYPFDLFENEFLYGSIHHGDQKVSYLSEI